jgi:hypothetical protein
VLFVVSAGFPLDHKSVSKSLHIFVRILTPPSMIQTQRVVSIVKSLVIGSLSTGLLMWFVHLKTFSRLWLLTVFPLRLTSIAFMITVSSALHPFEDDPKIFVASSTL